MNDRRARILEEIWKDPGVTCRELALRLGCTPGAVSYHLYRLRRAGRVVASRSTRSVSYFRPDGPFVNAAKDVVAALRHPTLRALAQAICDCPGLRPSELAAKPGQSPSGVAWSLGRLEAVGLVRAERAGHRNKLFPGPAVGAMDLSRFELYAPNPGKNRFVKH